MSEELVSLDLTKWREFMTAIYKKGQDAAAILKAVFSIYGFQDIQDHFRDEKGPDGARWQARKASTQAMYFAISTGRRRPPRGTTQAQFNPSNKLLQMTGQLRQSILPAGIRQIGKGSIAVFSNSDHSAIHDQGNPGRGMPKRGFMWLSDEARTKMAESAVSIWVQGGRQGS